MKDMLAKSRDVMADLVCCSGLKVGGAVATYTEEPRCEIEGGIYSLCSDAKCRLRQRALCVGDVGGVHFGHFGQYTSLLGK